MSAIHDRLNFVIPETMEELDELRYHFHYLAMFMPRKPIGFDDFLTNNLGNIALIFIDMRLVASYYLILSKRSAELGGMYDMSLKKEIGRPASKSLLVFISYLLLNHVFNELKKDKIILKIQKDMKAGHLFARKWGFVPLQNTEYGQTIYKLTKEKYLADRAKEEQLLQPALV